MSKEELWGNGSGAAKVLTTSFVVGDAGAIQVGDDNELHIFATLSGTDATTVDIKVECSFDCGTTWDEIPSVVSSIDGSLDTEYWIQVVPPRCPFRMSLKRTGGDGTTAAYVEVAARDQSSSIYDPVATGLVARSSLPAPSIEGEMVAAIGDLFGRQMTAAFDLINQADRTSRTNPDHGQRENDEIVDIVNGVSTNGAGTTYDYYFSPSQFGKFALHFVLDGGVDGGSDTGITLTIFGTLEDGPTAKESRKYYDFSTAYLGAASYNQANGTSGEVFINDSAGLGQCLTWVRLRLVVSANTGTADWRILKGQRYI